ncbi:MAG: hypothetical protein WDN09_03040 [bacterium]
MKSRSIALVIITTLAVIVTGFYVLSPRQIPPAEVAGDTQNTEPPIFTWKYEQAETLNPDGIPETNVFLQAAYPDRETQTKLIDTTPGSCNELPDADADTYEGTKNIQCYSAGLGYRYKIIEGKKSYLVERQMFEEGTPDYDPPAQKYEVLKEFLLSN